MFRVLGKFVTRFWPLLLAGWILLLVGTWQVAPPWAEVAQDREFGFLPESAPSRQSEAAFQKAFPDDRLASNIVLVLTRADRAPGSLEQDKKFIEDVLETDLRQIATEEGGLASEATAPEEPLFPSDTESARPQQPQQQK